MMKIIKENKTNKQKIQSFISEVLGAFLFHKEFPIQRALYILFVCF